VPPKSDFAHNFVHVQPLERVELLTAGSNRIDFDLSDGLRLVVETHAPGVFRLRGGTSAGLTDKPRSYRDKANAELLLARQEAVGEAVLEPCVHGNGWRITQGDTALEILMHPLRLALFRGDTQVLASKVSGPAPAFGYDVLAEPAEVVWTASFELQASERLYGLGETSGVLDRRGEDIISDDPEHRALPLAWSPSGWGVYVNTFQRVHHALGVVKADDTQADDTYLITVNDTTLDLFFFVGEPAEILNQYTALTGRPGQPVLWAMGVWMRQPEGEIATQIAALVLKLRALQLPIDAVALALPAVWGFQADKLQLAWDAVRFPDARQWFALFHSHHVHVSAPGFPGVLANSPLFEELADRGWLLTDPDGNAQLFAGTKLSAGLAYGLLDLTQRDVYLLWAERQRQLFDEGLDAPACDIQIAVPDEVTARRGESGPALRTLYPLLARHALHDAVASHKVPPEGIVMSTDLFPAAQRWPWQCGPRTSNDWQGLEHSLRTALSIGASGLPVQVHAIGNADAPSEGMTEELYLRWLTLGIFSANFSLEGAARLLPEAFGENALTQARYWLQWRYRLIPYVVGAVEDAARTGLPVQRSMAMMFPNDVQAHHWESQYLLGPSLLVAPIVKSGHEIEVYFPQGEAWWDLNTGYRYEGGTRWLFQCGIDQYPVFGREGHMLCLGPAVQHTGELNSARLLDEVWMFGMPIHNPVVMRNKIRVMQMQGSSYIKGLEGLRILPSEGLAVIRRGGEVRISRVR
jgi:alpha-glucosidase (family GH31 glycosyl hydrolase)